MNPCTVKSVLRLFGDWLLLGLLTGMAGCTKTPHSIEHAEVSGKVLFQGKPLPGGQVTFVTVQGFASSAPIDENGNYQIKAPTGEVQIGVENRFLLPSKRGPEKGFHPRRPGSKVEEKPIKGRYVKISSRYSDPTTSGLTCTVKPGPQTHDIELSDNPSPAPAAPGR
jgi:hypothetical protein